MTVSKNKPNQPYNGSESGFSLIEVCIALIVIGLLMAPIIQTYNLYIQSKKVAQSTAVVGLVNSALIKYVEKYGRYPRPTDPSIPQGGGNFGKETATAAGWPACNATSTVVCQTNVNTFTGGVVLIGDIPFATLGIPYKSTLDGYGNKLTYAVTQLQTVSTSFLDTIGQIEVLKLNNNSIYATPATQRSHFIIVSHGEDGNGAFTLSGIRTNPCGALAASRDNENCNNDGRFISNYDDVTEKNVRFYAAGAAYFDDFTSTTNVSATGLWTYIPNSSMQMKSTPTGNIYIGACPLPPTQCMPLSHIDVQGDVRGNQINTARICAKNQKFCRNDFTTYNPRTTPTPTGTLGWFSPAMLTGAPATPPALPLDSTTSGYQGAGIRCYGDKALRGIRNYDEVCAYQGTLPTSQTLTPYFKNTVTVTNCTTPGTYARGITISGTNITMNCASP